MNILLSYLLSEYLKTIFKVILIFYCFGLILNLFEEIEFFKNTNTTILMPIALTALYIPNMIIKLLPFIIFISSMWFLLQMRNSRDLLSLKVFGFSNFKIFLTLATTSFIIGWIFLFAINPITSAMIKYYEKTKSEYSLDIDHLVTINKNGLWIKENTTEGQRITSADQTKQDVLNNVTIFQLNKNFELVMRLDAKSANISKNKWEMKNVNVSTFEDGIAKSKSFDKYYVKSQYNHAKITGLFRNFDTMSFLELILNYENLQKKGYSKPYLDQNLNSMMSIPFFLFIMTSLASILTMNTLRKSNNFAYIFSGLITCVVIYYFKDLSLALGQTNRISLSLSAWIPIISIGLFSSIGILQINEK